MGTARCGLAWSLLSLLAVCASSVKRVILDSDTAMTVNQPQFPHPTDIDDDLAILWALNQERLGKLRIEGIISTFGNANLSGTHADALLLARQAGINAPIFRGGDFNSSLLDKTPGVDFLIAHLEWSKLPFNSPATILSIGSLFSLASAVTRAPSLVGSLGEIVLLGGSTVHNHPFATNHLANLNFKAAPKATNVVLGLPVRKVSLTMELCMQVLWTQREWEAINEPRCKGSVIAAHYLRVQQWMNQMGAAEHSIFFSWSQFGKATRSYEPKILLNSTIPWDALAVMYVTNPEWFGDERCYEMQLLIEKKNMFSKELPCEQCAADQWVYCVVVPMKIVDPLAVMRSLTDALCDTPLVG